jgi:hypothetical protein
MFIGKGGQIRSSFKGNPLAKATAALAEMIQQSRRQFFIRLHWPAQK